MADILLVEPPYRSKFPPLGLMRISTYHKERGDTVVFVRGEDPEMKSRCWNRVYVSSLFTWELPKTLEMLRFYADCVSSPQHLVVGGIGATLLPNYIEDRIKCKIVRGLLNRPNMLGRGSRVIASLPPDYDLLHAVDYDYRPLDAYFVRVTQGCPNQCKFCAVPMLEPKFCYLQDIKAQVGEVGSRYSEKQDLIVLDNNILASPALDTVVGQIIDCGFAVGAKRHGRKRIVDFNQGIDARIIAKNPRIATLLGRLPIKPIRLAFDYLSPAMERDYRRAVKLLAEEGFTTFTTYLLYNFRDSPGEFYRRLEINAELNQELGVQISGFPMRYIPITDCRRGYVSRKWKWRWLRGIQCVLQATRGLVSPNPKFMRAAFGRNEGHFFNILSMPDRYIIYREHYRENGADDWLRQFRRLSNARKEEFLDLLEALNRDWNKDKVIRGLKKYRSLVEHYYPNGGIPPRVPYR